MQRNNDLDVLRGILLIIITINHVGGPLSRLAFQPMGFVTSAEGFIFLSGNVLGFTFGKRLLEGNKISFKTVLRRSFKIYKYHILILAASLLPFIITYPNSSRWQSSELLPFFEQTVPAVISYLLLLFQPHSLDILPMYVIYIPIGFIALTCFANQKAKYVFAASILFWFIGQSEFSYALIHTSNPFRTSSFDLLSWQLLFILGCFFGYSRSIGHQIILKNKSNLIVCLTLFFAFAFVRYGDGLNGEITETLRNFSDKSDLQIFRLVNFLVIAYLIDYLISTNYFPNFKAAAFLGRHSLQVFSFQTILLYYYLPFRGDIYEIGSIAKLTVQCVFVLLLFIPAFIHQYLLNKRLYIKSQKIQASEKLMKYQSQD